MALRLLTDIVLLVLLLECQFFSGKHVYNIHPMRKFSQIVILQSFQFCLQNMYIRYLKCLNFDY